MNPIVYIGFCAGAGWLSRIIEWFSGGPSHAFLLYRDSEFDGWINLGEELGGWVSQPGEATDAVTTLVRLPNVDLWVGLRKNRCWLGSPYAVGALLGMAWWEVLHHWFKRVAKNPFSTKGSWYCSGIIQKVLQDSGVAIELDPSVTDPAHLLEEVRKLGAIECDFKEVVS